MNVTKREWTSPAALGEGEIYSCAWTGPQVRQVLLLAHGMAEYSGRYDSFTRYLAQRGIAVYANDHAGHGKSTQPQGHLGDWDACVEDLRRLSRDAGKDFPEAPQALLGHSMGSFLARSYAAKYGAGLSGCVLCGTMGKNPGVPLGRALASLQCKIAGPKSRGRLLSLLAFAGYNKKIPHPVNGSAWLASDDQVCLDYEADPLCGFPFTAAGYRALFTGVASISGTGWASQVPKDLPLLLLAGEEDPVGAWGKGPRQVAQWLAETATPRRSWSCTLGCATRFSTSGERSRSGRRFSPSSRACKGQEKRGGRKPPLFWCWPGRRTRWAPGGRARGRWPSG